MGMDSSIADRLRENRKRKRLRRLRLFLVLIGIIALSVGVYYFLHRPSWAYGHITISGTKKITEDDVLRIAGQQRPINLFNISTRRVRYALQHDVRFHSVEVENKWPDELRIVAQEREPALYVANAYQSYLKLDYKGVVVAVSKGIPDGKAPLLVGEACGNVFIGDTVKNPVVFKVLEFQQKVGQEAMSQVVEFVHDDKVGMKLRLRSGIIVLLGQPENIPKKVDLYLTVFNEIKDKNIQAEYIDLTFAKPYIRLREGALKEKK